ncbi:MAG TPA: nuclear transport factor 2 family protein [Gemmatimonadales bacterium]|jgi:hypothetical protein|nr:nuclear transport factor 2 family protein [Gemmatimonadales bacterium]
MSRLHSAALYLGLLAIAGCRIEDHTPTGSRRDEEAVQSLVAGYARSFSERDWSGARALFWPDASYSGPLLPITAGAHQAVPIDFALSAIARRLEGLGLQRFDLRVLRADFRQEGELAGVWMTTRRRLPVAGDVVEGDWIEHLVLRRIDGQWRILSVTAIAAPRGGPRERR